MRHAFPVARVTQLPSSAYTAMPWRNGAGTTHEIAIDPAPGPSGAPFRWRLSMADLAGSGPFSEIPGVDRVLVLLAGDEVALAIDGAPPVPLARHAAIAFPGDVPTALTMRSGAGRDLNLMWDRTRATGRVEVIHPGDVVTLRAQAAFAIALGGPAAVRIDDDVHRLGEQDTLRIVDGSELVATDGDVYVALID